MAFKLYSVIINNSYKIIKSELRISYVGLRKIYSHALLISFAITKTAFITAGRHFWRLVKYHQISAFILTYKRRVTEIP